MRMRFKDITKLGLIAGLAVQGLLGCAAEGEAGALEPSVLEPQDLAPGEVDQGAAGAGDELGLVREGILGGTETTSFPAVGKLIVNGIGNCTGVLISSQVVLTNAHCFNYDTNISGLGGGATPPNNSNIAPLAFFDMFNQFPPSGMAQDLRRTVKRVYMVDNAALGATDIAIVQLSQTVPANYATPYKIASNPPAQGSLVQGIGYGCVESGVRTNGKKKYRGALWQASGYNTDPMLGCEGDSGGPILNSSGQIVALISWHNGAGRDLFARPIEHRSIIDRINAIYGVQQPCTTCGIMAFQTQNRRNFLQFTNNGDANSVINASATSVGASSVFRVVHFSRSPTPVFPAWVALQTSSGRFVSTVGGGVGNVKVSNEIFTNELFYIEQRSGGGRSLKTNHAPNKFFITAENAGGGTVSSNRTAFGPWETFF